MCKNKYICPLCNREVSSLTCHHLVPIEIGGKCLATIWICPTCHRQIHALYTNKELAYRLYTLEKLKSDKCIKKYLNFISKIPGDTIINIKKSKRIRNKR